MTRNWLEGLLSTHAHTWMRFLFVCALGWGVQALGAVDVSANTTLSADTDWRGQGTVTIAADATLDLNGHLLQVDALAGAGRITDSQHYDLLEYVQSTGAQRVPTGYIPGSATMMEVDFTSEGNANKTLYGTKSWSTYRYLCMVANNSLYFFGEGKAIGISENVRYRSIVRNQVMSLLRLSDNTIIGNVAAVPTNTDGTQLMFFGLSGSGYYGKFRLYEARVWDSKNLRLDLVPARNAATGAVGLFNRVDGTLHVSDTGTALVAGTATGATLGIGSLRIAATDGAFNAGFTGTVDSHVRSFVDGTVTLAADADWRALGTCAIAGTVDLNGHDLRVAALNGIGTVTDSTPIFDELDYVECDNQQRVLTGVVPSTDTAVELDIMTTDKTYARTCTYMGCKSWTTYRYLMFSESSRNFYFFGSGNIACQGTANTRYKLSVTPGTSPNGTFKVLNGTTGAQLGSVSVSLTNSDNSQLALFSQSEDLSRAGAFRLYSAKITKAGTLVRNFKPVRNPRTGAVGLLDTVNGKFYPSDSGTALLAGTVASASGTPGHLRVEVPADATNVNAGLALTGSLELVKEGAGTLTAIKEAQSYTGGTRIRAGEVNLLTGGYVYDFIASYCYFGSLGSVYDRAIVVETNAVFDIKGNFDNRLYALTLAGGTVRNSGHKQWADGGSLGTITLTEDSTVDAVRDLTFYDIYDINLKLGGHTLTLNTRTSSYIYFNNAALASNGTLDVIGTGTFQILKSLSARTVALRMGAPMSLSGTVDIGDYTALCTTDANAGTAALNVYGRFTPTTDYFYGCTLQDGATLDVSAKTGTWSTTSAFTKGSNRVTFADGATVTIDANARANWSGKIVDWGAGNQPTNTRFTLDAASRARGRSLAVYSDGLYAASGTMIIIW